MADRYWVGGTASWDATAGTKWATTSGGAGGASVPTSADNVFFDAASGTSTVTLSSSTCSNLDCTGFTGTITGSANLFVYGTVFKLSSGMTFSHTGSVFLNNNAASTVLITTAGKSLFGLVMGQSSSTSTVFSLQDALALTSGINLTAGAFTTNNFNVSASQISSSNSNVRTINLGSSTVTLSISGVAIDFGAGTNLTFNTGTSAFVLTGNAPTVAGGTKSFYDISITGTFSGAITLSAISAVNNLAITAPSTAGTRVVSFSINTTINGTLSVSGTTATQRIQFGSNTAGTQRTLSVATIGTLTNTNWQDIALTGAASPWTAPMSAYDLGNNSGITFDTTPLYWVGGAGTWTDATHWSTSSGGAGGAGVPGPTNNVRIDASSGTGTQTGGSTTTPSYCKDYDSSGSSITNSSVYLVTYGSFKCRSGVTNSFIGIVFNGTGTHTVDPNGSTNMSAGGGFDFRGIGTYTLMNNWVSGNAFAHYSGTLNTNGYSVSGNVFSCNGNLVRTLNLGASTLTFTSSTAFDFSGTNLTLNAGTSTLNCGGNFYGNGNTFYNVNFNDSSGTDVLTGSNTYNNLDFAVPGSGALKRVEISGTHTVNGTLTANGTVANGRLLLYPTGLGSAVPTITISAANTSLSYVDFWKINATGSGSWSGTSLGNCGGNSGITFTTPKTVYWKSLAGGDFFSTVWATSSGGTPVDANYPLPQDTAIIDDAGLSSGSTITYCSLTYAPLPNIDASSKTTPFSLSGAVSPFVCGNITLNSNASFVQAQSWYIVGSCTYTLGGATDNNRLYIYGTLTVPTTTTFSGVSGHTIFSSGTLTLNGNTTFNTSLSQSGTVNLNTYTLTSTTCTLGAASTTNFGTGKISLTGNAATIFTGNATQVVTGTPVVECTYSGATGTRTIGPSTPTEANTISFNITAGTDTISVSSGSSIKNLDFTGFAGTSTNAVRTIYGNLIFSSGMTLSVGTGTTTFAATSGTKTIATNGKTLDFPITFNGLGGTWQLADNLLQGSTRSTLLTNGTLDLNGKTYTPGSIFQINAGTKNITFNGGTLLCTGTTSAFFNNAPTNFTTTAGTGTGKISLNNASAKTFTGAESVYNCTLENAGAGALTITGSNTFTTISNSVQPTSFLFTGGTTTTVTNFNVSGTSGNLVTIGSTTTVNHTLSKSTGEVNVSYCSISRSTATGGATWKAYTSNGNVNGGNNSGWLFSEFTANGLLFGSNF